jgi:DNA polymerase-3 subunit delta'
MTHQVVRDPGSTQTHNWQIVGHDWAAEYLQRVVASDRQRRDAGEDGDTRLRHAYLFVGPPNVGKSTLVHAFAQALLCTGNGADSPVAPCGECRSCRLMAKRQHPDFRLVSPTDKDGNVDRVDGLLRAEQSTELIHQASLRPMEGRYKVFHIQDAQLAHVTFSNKILKTLEEPPKHVVICVTAVDRNLLLPTIVSRCELVELRPVPVAAAESGLVRDWQASPQQAELLARLSGGRYGWAVRQLADDAGASQRLAMLEELRGLVNANRVDRLRFAEQIAAGRDNQNLFGMLELWVTWWRDVLLTQYGLGDAINNLDQPEEVQHHARTLSSAAVQHHLDTLLRVERYLHHTVNTRLAMDALLLDLPRPVA